METSSELAQMPAKQVWQLSVQIICSSFIDRIVHQSTINCLMFAFFFFCSKVQSVKLRHEPAEKIQKKGAKVSKQIFKRFGHR